MTFLSSFGHLKCQALKEPAHSMAKRFISAVSALLFSKSSENTIGINRYNLGDKYLDGTFGFSLV